MGLKPALKGVSVDQQLAAYGQNAAVEPFTSPLNRSHLNALSVSAGYAREVCRTVR
jgi:hypothetical protein